PQKLRDDLRVESGAPGRDPAERFDELLDVADPVLEQVPDTRGTATGRRAEQVSCVPGLDVLGEHQHPRLGVVTADDDRGAQALIGVAGGIRTSTTAASGSCSSTAASRSSALPTAATTSWPLSARISARPARTTAESSAITIR